MEHEHDENSVPNRETGGADPAHSLTVTVGDLEGARALIEELELEGIPPGAISLIAPEEGPERDQDDKDGVFRDVAKSVFIGAVGGAIAGAALGLLVRLLVVDLTALVAILLGGLFGTIAGGIAGGMSVVKYSSPAWRRSHQAGESHRIAVGVEHSDAAIIDSAEKVISSRGLSGIERPGS